MIIRDVTARYESEARLCELASLGMLTRLASRGAFMTQLDPLTEAGVPCMLLMMDLDGFNEVNDTLGHAACDALLCHVAEQIRLMCTGAIIAARLGGDEFIILLPDGNDNAGSTADRLIAAVQTPFRYHCSPVVVGASTGIAYCPEYGKNAFAVMSAADLALYRAKASGKGRSVLSGRRFASLNSGDGALSVSWKLPCGTSSSSCTISRLLGCEVLVRWQHPARSLLLPAEFNEMLVKSPLSVVLADWIIRTSLVQIRQWQARCCGSASTCSRASWPGTVLKACRERLPAAMLPS